MATRQDTLNEEWASDISINAFKDGNVSNMDAINQSLELILGTIMGERLFNINFGSMFQTRLFSNIDVDFLDNLLNDTVTAIKKWEDRVVVIEDAVRLSVVPDSNVASIYIPYIVKNIGVKNVFSKKIVG